MQERLIGLLYTVRTLRQKIALHLQLAARPKHFLNLDENEKMKILPSFVVPPMLA